MVLCIPTSFSHNNIRAKALQLFILDSSNRSIMALSRSVSGVGVGFALCLGFLE